MVVSVETDGGDRQRGVIGHPLEKSLLVKLRAPEGFDVAFHDVTFNVTGKPGNASGEAVGANAQATGTSYTVKTSMSGQAWATMVLGNAEGTYTIEASSPASSEPPATFTATAQKPDAIRIVLGGSDPTFARASYQTTFLDRPLFTAVGVDASGARIGPVRSSWKIAAKGKTPPSGSVDPVSQTATTTFNAASLGTAVLVADPEISGIANAQAQLVVKPYFIDVGGNVSRSSIDDDLAGFVPGSRLDGLPVPLPTGSTDTLQVVKVRLFNRNRIGSVRLSLSNVSSYPGIAMNWPITGASTNPDMDFGASADPDCPKRECVTVPLTSDDQVIDLYVRDFAAKARLDASITHETGTIAAATQQLPLDANGNGVPDAGWKFVNNVASAEYLPVQDGPGISAGADDDATPTAQALLDPITHQPKSLGIAGDGLTTLEEYRGFVVKGLLTRTNPHRKDLFVLMDEVLVHRDSVFLSLPLTFHYILSSEAVTDGPIHHPMMNPNRGAALLNASAQYGLTVEETTGSELIIVTDSGVEQPAYALKYGRAFLMGESLSRLPYDADVRSLASPNETKVVRVFSRAFGHEGITNAPGQGMASTPILCGPGQVRGCDELNIVENYIYPGSDQILDTLRVPPDLGLENVARCEGPISRRVDQDFIDMVSAITAHEAGHGVMIDHANFYGDYCGQTVTWSPGAIDPVPQTFAPVDSMQIRLHLKHP